MNEFESASSFPPASTVAVVILGMAAATLLVRRRDRLSYSLSQMALMLTVSRLTNLGEISGLAKLCTGFSLLFVFFAAAYHPGPRRPLSLWALAYPVLAVMSVAPILGAIDWRLALVIRLQWVLMAFTAVLVAGTLVDTASLNRCLRSLGYGLGLGICVAMTSLVVDPSGSFYSGLGRFTPYGCNPNQFAIAFALTTVIGLYQFAVSDRSLSKALWAGFVLIGSIGGLMCVSRMAMGVMALAGAPSVMQLCRRPVLAVVMIGFVALAGLKLIHSESEFDLTHIENSKGASRWTWTADVLDEVHRRPLFGLMFAEHARAHEEGLNAHNAYIEMAYLCGMIHAVPNALMVLFSLGCMTRCLLSSRSRYDTLAIRVLSAVLVASIVNGFVNNIIYYPTYTWAFLHLLLSVIFVSEAMRPITPGRAEMASASWKVTPRRYAERVPALT